MNSFLFSPAGRSSTKHVLRRPASWSCAGRLFSLGVALWLCAPVAGRAQTPAPEHSLAVVKERVLTLLLGSGEGPRRLAAIAELDARCDKIMAEPLPDAAWKDPKDIRVNFRLAELTDQLRFLAIAYRCDASRHHQSPQIRERVREGMRMALESFDPAIPRLGAWFHWLISIPDDLGAIGLLMGDDLPVVLLTRMKAHLAVQMGETMTLTNANAAWQARPQVYLALLDGDSERLRRAAAHAFSGVRYSTVDGVREDYGYLFHGQLPYAGGGYGLGFAQTLAQFMYSLDGTPWTATPGQREVIANLLLEHTLWFVESGRLNIVVTGRTYEERKDASPLLEALLLMSQVDTPRRTELAGAAAQLVKEGVSVALGVTGPADANSDATPAVRRGFRYWPSAETGAFKGDGFQIGFRQYSRRVHDYEFLTLQGAEGWNLAYGFVEVIRADGHGDWYGGKKELSHDIDMQHLPATTTRIGAHPVNPTDRRERNQGFSLNLGRAQLAGGAGEGASGAAGFELIPTYGDFVARKSLHFFPEGYWALGSGLTSAETFGDPAGPIHTTVLQWALHDGIEPELTLSGGRRQSAPTEATVVTNVEWLWLDGAAVIFAEPAAIVVQRRGHVVSAWIDHGVRPKDAGYAYAVLPKVTLKEAQAFAAERPVRPISRDNRVHAVSDAGRGTDSLVFFEPAVCAGVQVNHPLVVHRRRDAGGAVFTVQNPLHDDAGVELVLEAEPGTFFSAEALSRLASAQSTEKTTVAVATEAGRIYRFGFGDTGRKARSEPAVDLAAFRDFRVEAKHDAENTLLTLHLPPEAVNEGYELSLHASKGHRLEVFTDADIVAEPAPGVRQYLWRRKETFLRRPISYPSPNFHLTLSTSLKTAGAGFSMPPEYSLEVTLAAEKKSPAAAKENSAGNPQPPAALETVRRRVEALLVGGEGKGPRRQAGVASIDRRCRELMSQPLDFEGWGGRKDEWMIVRLVELADQMDALAVAYRSNASEFHGDPAVRERILASLRLVLENMDTAIPRQGNWFRWKIQLPHAAAATGLLMEDELPAGMLARLRAQLAFQMADMVLTGANAAWEARNNAFLALLDHDGERLEKAADHMFGAVRYSASGGVREDYAYLFHGRIPYAGDYGGGFAETVSQFMWLLDGTPWAAKSEKSELIANFLLEHARWFFGGKRMDLLITGRNYRPKVTTENPEPRETGPSTRLSDAMVYMTQVNTSRRSEMRAAAAEFLRHDRPVSLAASGMADALSGVAGHGLEGFRYWYSAEIGVFKGQGFHVGFRQYSRRVQDYEYLSQGGGDGWYLGYGFTNVLRTDDRGSWLDRSGKVIPAMDFEYLPGTTARVNAHPTNPLLPRSGNFGFSLNYGTAELAGGAGFERGGVAGFELVPTYGKFSARKSLHFFPHGFWALGSAIDSQAGTEETLPVLTTLMQRTMAVDRAEKFLVNGEPHPLLEGTVSIPAVKWLWADGVGMVLFEPASVTVRWTQGVLTIWLDHGIQPRDSGYAYAMLPVASADETRSFADRPSVRPIRRDRIAHAVRDIASGDDSYVFFEAGEVEDVRADAPLILHRHREAGGMIVTVQNPLHTDVPVRFAMATSGDLSRSDPEVTVEAGANDTQKEITLASVVGRIHRFGFGEAGKRAVSIPRQDLAAFERFKVEAESDPERTLLTMYLPEEAVRNGFSLSVHGNKGHWLADLDDMDIVKRVAPNIIQYAWRRGLSRDSKGDPIKTTGIRSDYRIDLSTSGKAATAFFTVPALDRDGHEVKASAYRRDPDNPHRN